MFWGSPPICSFMSFKLEPWGRAAKFPKWFPLFEQLGKTQRILELWRLTKEISLFIFCCVVASIPEEEDNTERACDTLLMCILTVLNHGLRNGGGVGDILRKPSKDVSTFETVYVRNNWPSLIFLWSQECFRICQIAYRTLRQTCWILYKGRPMQSWMKISILCLPHRFKCCSFLYSVEQLLIYLKYHTVAHLTRMTLGALQTWKQKP